MLLIHLFPLHSLRLSSAISSTPVISSDFNLPLRLALKSRLSISPPIIPLAPSFTPVFSPARLLPFFLFHSFDNLCNFFHPPRLSLSLLSPSVAFSLPPSLPLFPYHQHPRVHLGCAVSCRPRAIIMLGLFLATSHYEKLNYPSQNTYVLISIESNIFTSPPYFTVHLRCIGTRNKVRAEGQHLPLKKTVSSL